MKLTGPGGDGAQQLIARLAGRRSPALLGVTPWDPSGLQVKYQFDAENRVSDVRRLGASTAWAHGFSYHPSGAPDSYTAGNGKVHTQSFTPRHWPDVLASGVVHLDYGYDEVGNVTSIQDAVAGLTQSHTYDDVDRLVSANGQWGAGSFGYDAAGNRTSKTIAGATTSYAYNSSTGRLTSSSGAEIDSYGYDQNGNLTSSTGRGFTYTPENMQETATVDGLTTTYRYDGDQARALKMQGSRVSYYVHAPGGQLLSEVEEPCPGAVVPVRDYVYAGGRLIASVRPLTGPATLGFSAPSSVAGESGLHAVSVSLTTANGQPTVCEARVSFTAAPGTAVQGRDWTLTAGTLVFPAGSASGSTRAISVSILPDGLDEDDETLTLQLSSPVGAGLGLAGHTVAIVDDDPTPTVSILPATLSVTEGDVGQANASLTVALSAMSGRPVGVKYATVPGTALSGVDFIAGSGTLSFVAESETSKVVVVRVIGDTLVEEAEGFGVVLSEPTNAVISGGSSQVTLSDDDTPRAPQPPHADFDGDGDADILWHNQTTGALYVWLMDGTVNVGGSYLTPSAVSDVNWQVRGLADFDGDGDTDILWHHRTSGALYVWLMEGTVQVGGSYLTPSAVADVNWQIQGLADFDGDGDIDIVWRHQVAGDLFLWVMNGLVQQGGMYLASAQYPGPAWQIRGVADLSKDGQPDLLWHYQPNGTLYAWLMSGTTTTSGAYPTRSQVPDTNWQVRMVADFNGDQQPDLLWHHRTTGELYVWYLDGLVEAGGSYLTPSTYTDSTWQIVPR